MPPEQEGQTALVDMVRVTVVGMNGEWLESVAKLGEEVKLEIVAHVDQLGNEVLADGQKRKFLRFQVDGVRKIE